MKTGFTLPVLMLAVAAAAADKPRVYVTESQPLHISGDAEVGDAKGSLLVAGGATRENVEVIRNFARLCPGVQVTASREKADFVVRLDHEASNPTTPFVRSNKIAIFDKQDDLVYSGSTRFLGNAVKDACAALQARIGR